MTDYSTAPGTVLELGICLVKYEHALMAHCMKTQQQFGPIETLSAVNLVKLPDLFCPFCQVRHRILSWLIAGAFGILRPDQYEQPEIPAN
jgi:hypothetical protein